MSPCINLKFSCEVTYFLVKLYDMNYRKNYDLLFGLITQGEVLGGCMCVCVWGGGMPQVLVIMITWGPSKSSHQQQFIKTIIQETEPKRFLIVKIPGTTAVYCTKFRKFFFNFILKNYESLRNFLALNIAFHKGNNMT